MKLTDNFKREFLEGVVASFGNASPSVELWQQCSAACPWEGKDKSEWYDPSLSPQEMGKNWGRIMQKEFEDAFCENAPDGFDPHAPVENPWQAPWLWSNPELWFSSDATMADMGREFAELNYEEMEQSLQEEEAVAQGQC